MQIHSRGEEAAKRNVYEQTQCVAIEVVVHVHLMYLDLAVVAFLKCFVNIEQINFVGTNERTTSIAVSKLEFHSRRRFRHHRVMHFDFEVEKIVFASRLIAYQS